MKTLQKSNGSLSTCQAVVDEFLALWKSRRHVLGAMLVGSYATGLETPMSDIDICIVLSDEARYWKRGNATILDKLVEYGAYPIGYLKDLQEADLREGMRLRTRMLATGVVIFDKLGVLERLQGEARLLLKRKLPRLGAEIIEKRKYLLWDQMDNLRDLWQRSAPGFPYAYYAGLHDLVKFYAAFLRLEIARPTRIYPLLTDEDFRKKYGIEEIPDKWFCTLFVDAMQSPSLPIFERLTDHVQKETGGFSIDGWTLYLNLPRKL